MSRATWHLRANAPVVGWLLVLVVVTFVHPFVPQPRWLMVHLLLLGAVSNAIVVWSAHFSDALLRSAPSPGERRRLAARLVLLNTGVLLVVTGVFSGLSALTVSGAAGVAVAAGWHGWALFSRARRALPSRFGATVRYYVAAAATLPLGAALGTVLATGAGGSLHPRIELAHASVNLLGWVGLTVTGTLVTLWPTMLRTRIAAGAERAAQQAMPVLVGAVIVVPAGALLGLRWLAAAGVLGYLAGLAVTARPWVVAARGRPPSSYPTWSVLTGCGWLCGALLALAWILVTSAGWTDVSARVDVLTAPLAVGFVAQVLLGALSYLAPVVLGGGPAAVRSATATLERAGALRITVANLGLLVCVLPVPSLVRVLTSLLVLLALAAFLPLLLTAVWSARRHYPFLSHPWSTPNAARAGSSSYAADPARGSDRPPAQLTRAPWRAARTRGRCRRRKRRGG